jgi:hypothetical protein
MATTDGRSADKWIRAAQALFLLMAAIWLVIGVATLARGDLGGGSGWVAALVVGALMFGNAGAYLLAGLGIGTRWRRLFFYFGLAVLLVNLVLTFTDEVGLLDWVTAGIDLVLLLLLVVTRRRYTGARGGRAGPRAGLQPAPRGDA